jgi:hypothetical protein
VSLKTVAARPVTLRDSDELSPPGPVQEQARGRSVPSRAFRRARPTYGHARQTDVASTPGYWTAWSQGGTIRLEHLTTGASDQTIANAGSSAHPHLVSYGSSHMLLAWRTGSSMAAQVRDSGTGAAVGAQFTIAVNDHSYQAFKAYPGR